MTTSIELQMKFVIKILLFVLYLASFEGAILEFVPEMEDLSTLIHLINDLLITLLGLISITKTSKKLLFSFCLLLVLSTINLVNGISSIITHINGLRELTNLLFVFVLIKHIVRNGYLEYLNKYFKKFVIVFLFSQIPLAILQYINRGYEPGDWVSGTLGVGGSGTLTLSIFVLVYYLIENDLQDVSPISKSKYLLLRLYYFIPCFLNETKITFLLIPLMFISFINLKRIRASLWGVLFAITGIMFLSSIYLKQDNKYSNPFTEIFSANYLESYLAGDETSFEDIPRLTKIILAFKILSEDNNKLFFGESYGTFKGGSKVELSPFAEKYNWLLSGTRPYIFYLLITGGLSLLILFIYFFSREVIYKPSSRFENSSSRLLFFLTCIWILVLFYSDAFRSTTFNIIFIYLIIYSKYFKLIPAKI